MKIKSYRDLDVWRNGIDIVDQVYEVTAGFPQNEQYGLAAHMQRTAISIPSNVAEGFGRQYVKEYQQFCHIALGSCAELDTQVVIAHRRSYITPDTWSTLEEALDHESRMLWNLIKKLKETAS